ncbi:MAG: transposase [Streptosporangiaceae bacterium]
MPCRAAHAAPRRVPVSLTAATASGGLTPSPQVPDLARHYWRAKRLWAGSYFAGSVAGAPIAVLRQYIEQQEPPARPAHIHPPSPPG